MANPGVAAVAAKYAELLGDARRLRLELRAAEFGLEHVKVTLLLLDPDYPVSEIKPPRPRASPKTQTERNRMAIDFLRESATPMTSREIARQVLAVEGNPTPAPQVVDLVAAGGAGLAFFPASGERTARRLLAGPHRSLAVFANLRPRARLTEGR